MRPAVESRPFGDGRNAFRKRNVILHCAGKRLDRDIAGLGWRAALSGGWLWIAFG